ncbi:MAG TPA: PTS system mannose/fructose/sorbose family transporter subunit IID [Candidatus Limnocylindrales bacterium]
MYRKTASIGAALALAMLLAVVLPGTALGASGPDPTPVKFTVSLWQAALIAIGYYLANSPWLFGLAFFTLYRPLVAGFLVGLILGDPAQGTLIGAAINVPYLGFISAGGNLPADAGLAGWVGTTIALASGLDPTKAVTIAFGLGLLGTIIFYGRMAADSVFAHWADARAEKADIAGVAFMNLVPGQVFLFVFSFIPVFLLALNGPSAVQDALNALPIWTVNGLVIAGGILPAIGIALNMRFIFRGSAIPYFFIGYILMTATHGSISLVVVAALGLALAYLHLSFVRRDAPAPAEAAAEAAAGQAASAQAGSSPAGKMPVAGPGLAIRLTRGDLVKSWALWTFFAHANYNYERLQGTGFAHAMTPIIKRLYTTEDDIRAALKRHLVFFNTEPNFGNVVHGTVIAMEEQRANGAAIDDDAINSVKSGLMGPMAGIGDTLSQSTITPILLALGIGIAGGKASGTVVPTLTGATGNPLGPIIYVALVSIVIVAIGYTAWMQGYSRGRMFITEILKSGAIDRVLIGAGVMGNMVLGALAASFVVVNLAPTVTIAGAQMNLQAAVLDPLFPGALALGLVVMTWWLLRRRISPLALLAVYLVLSIVAAYPFFGPASTTSSDPAAQYQVCTSSLLHPYYACGAPPAPSAQP